MLQFMVSQRVRHNRVAELNSLAHQRKNKQTNKNSAQISPYTADLSAETLQARRDWQDIFKVHKWKNLQPKLLYPTRISFKIDGEIKSF